MFKTIADILIFGILKLNPENHLTAVAHFFVYDTIKILVLLFLMISLVGFLRSYISEEKLKQALSKDSFWGYFVASLFGAITPFCSCSSIPIFLSFVKIGLPVGVMFSFLVTSPIINEYLVALMLGSFGWKITTAYVLIGMTMAMVSGWVLGKMKLDDYLEKDFKTCCNSKTFNNFKTIKDRVNFGIHEAVGIIKKIWLWILVAILIGGFIHEYVPSELMQSYIAKTGVFSVPLAVLLGVPMYGSCASIVPIAVVLFKKGLPLGTALAFMMAISALSLPEAMILKRAMKTKLLFMFFLIATVGIIISGYMINFLQPMLMK